MSIRSRRARIVELLQQAGSATVAELVEEHHVSEMTIRRDLTELEEQGLLRRHRGGAVLNSRRSYEPPYLQREEEAKEDKRRIGSEAASLIAEGDSIAIDFGTTALQVARACTGLANITVVTPNVRAALELSESASHRVMLVGGRLRPGELAAVGPDAERAFSHYFVDRAFVGAAGFDLEHGLTDFNLDETSVKRALIRSAKEVVAVLDASKLGRVAFASVAPASEVDVFVTTADPEHAELKRLEELGIEVRCV